MAAFSVLLLVLMATAARAGVVAQTDGGTPGFIAASADTIRTPAEPFGVEEHTLHILSARKGGMFAPTGMADDEVVLTVELEVQEGDPQVVAKLEGAFDVWITDEDGRRSTARGATAISTSSGEIAKIDWMFGVPETADRLYLVFPDETVVELTSLLE